MRLNLLDLTFTDLEAFVLEDLKESKFRAGQLWQWLWQKGCRDFNEMTNISKGLRAKLGELAVIRWPEPEVVKKSKDGTVKFLFRLVDDSLIESVLIPGEGRYTQCLSSQVGCAMGCTFCNTGLMGFERNMTMGEILGQILAGRKYIQDHGMDPLKNLVFMGMGEPLNNVENVLNSLEALKSETGLHMSARRTTVSTVGLPKGLKALGDSGLALPAISLHAPEQELRARIMPKAARIHLDELMATLANFPIKPRERITCEYLLLKDVNDSLEHARKLADMLPRDRYKINLISYNPTEGLPYETPERSRVEAFEKYLWDRGMTAFIRRSMGRDIDAACGQLKAAQKKS